MKKQEFLTALREKLSTLPISDIEERLDFYAESIDDRMEDGLSEEEAVNAVGTVDEIVAQILTEIPLTKIVKEKVRPKRRMKTWEILLLSIGSPLWLSLGIAAFAVILSLYLSLWAMVISLWAAFASFAACGFGGIVGGIALACTENTLVGLILISAGIVCIGLAILLFFGCKAATKGTAILAKKIVIGIKFAFIGKGNKK